MDEMDQPKRQFVNFAFFKVFPEWRELSESERRRGKDEFTEVVKRYSERVTVLPYSLVGIRGDCDFMLWRISYRLEDFKEMQSELFGTSLGPYLHTPYYYLAMTRRSIYMDPIHPEHDEDRTRIIPGKKPYLFVYPFVKTREWYALPKEKRQKMMDEHITIGNKYPSVRLNTTYSYGLDDQEFVVAFETGKPEDFLDLVMELREAQASRFTKKDTPTFTCLAGKIDEVLDSLASTRRESALVQHG